MGEPDLNFPSANGAIQNVMPRGVRHPCLTWSRASQPGGKNLASTKGTLSVLLQTIHTTAIQYGGGRHSAATMAEIDYETKFSP